MPALTTAQADLDKAKAREQEARVAWNDARAHADGLRQALASGNGESITPADIATADATVEHTRLALQGATSRLAELSAAVQRARAEETCDSIVAVLPVLGSALLDTLDGVAAALAPVAPAAQAYDDFVNQSVHKLDKLAAFAPEPVASGPVTTTPRSGSVVESPFAPGAKTPGPERPKVEPFRRVNFRHLGQTTVDRMPVTPCRGAAQLAAVVLPAMVALGASSGLIDHLKELARGAPTIPTT